MKNTKRRLTKAEQAELSRMVASVSRAAVRERNEARKKREEKNRFGIPSFRRKRSMLHVNF